jgi:TolB-like protein/Flp pilus assembly protein TadD
LFFRSPSIFVAARRQAAWGEILIYRFEDYSLDAQRRELRCGPDLIAIEPQVFDLLQYLIVNRGRVVSKDDLIAAVWNGRIVSDSTLTTRINAVRCAVGDSGIQQRLIRTFSRKGIRFVGDLLAEMPAVDSYAGGLTRSQDMAEAGPSPATSSVSDAEGRVPALSGRPSVAVLPFEAMGGDAELDCFADGVTEDIITGLSRIKALWVIASTTMFTYKGRAVGVRSIGKDLGVQYVLHGRVRKAEGRLRMTAQLIETETRHPIWATKIDRASAGLFELQDDFAQCVVASAHVQLIVSEGRAAHCKTKPSSGVGDLLARSRERLYQATADGLKDLVSLAEKALLLDPANGEACRLLAAGIWHQAYRGFIPWDEATADRVMLFAQRAVIAEDADEYAHWMLGLAHLMARQHDRAVLSLRSALDINPSFSLAYGTLGTVLAWGGKSDESIANNELALRINPSDPLNPHRRFGLALAHYLASRYDNALENAALAVELRPDWWLGLIMYTASLAQIGRLEEARMACGDLRRAKPDMAVASLNSLPIAQVSDRDHVAEGLRKAGLSED